MTQQKIITVMISMVVHNEPAHSIGIIALPSMREFAQEVNFHLLKSVKNTRILPHLTLTRQALRENYLIEAEYFRFPNGRKMILLKP